MTSLKFPYRARTPKWKEKLDIYIYIYIYLREFQPIASVSDDNLFF